MQEEKTELEARLPEGEKFEPPQSFVNQANVTEEGIRERFREEWPGCWEEAADLLDWDKGYDEVLDDSDPPFYEWFTGGKLNASYNCVDRHVEDGRGEETAIEWEGELGDRRSYSFKELQTEVNEFASALRELGVEEDDVVSMYMPMVPQLPVAMLACSRIGAPHNVVFAGFSADALAKRMESCDSRYVVTCDGYYRRGEELDHIEKANDALESAEHEVDDVVVVNRIDGETPDFEENQHLYRDLLDEHQGDTVEPVRRDSEDMLFLMYTSGTTGEPKGVKHTTGGYMSHAAWTSRTVLDLEEGDNYWCSADIGWITGHTYIVYGPLALGATTVMYEGAPDYPDKDRLWEMIDNYDVEVFYTAPTAIRAFMRWGSEYPVAHDLSSLRLLGTVGEPINPRPWKWYYHNIGNDDCPIVDTWWQTETGGMMVTTIPGIDDMVPGTAGPPLPGIDARVVNNEGTEVEEGDAGYLTVQSPWPGMLRTLYRNDERFIEEYWSEYSEPEVDDWVYFPEDGAKIDVGGYITLLGRVDDVINVSGHRLGTMEVESAVVDVDGVAEAAVVGGSHEIKGEAVYSFVIPEDDAEPGDQLREDIKENVEEVIGPIARPEKTVFTDDLPKTRSGKIMRRLLKDMASGNDLGDTSTLRNPDIVEEINREFEE